VCGGQCGWVVVVAVDMDGWWLMRVSGSGGGEKRDLGLTKIFRVVVQPQHITNQNVCTS